MLKFAVKNQSLMRLDSFRAAEDSVNYLVAEFEILTDDWDGATITATFSNGEKTVDAVLIENRCLVPWEVLVKPVPVKVSLFGVKGDKIITTDICSFSNSCTQERGSSGKDPTPDAYQQIINMIEAGKVKGPQGDPGPQGPRGETGQTGPQGPIGETGQRGPQGEIGQTGQTGPAGQDGHTPVKGVDYWTASDKQEIYAEAEQALRDQEQSSVAAIRAAGADEVEKVQIKGAETLESIPEDYSALTAEVSGLKGDLDNKCHSIIYSCGVDKNYVHENSVGSAALTGSARFLVREPIEDKVIESVIVKSAGLVSGTLTIEVWELRDDTIYLLKAVNKPIDDNGKEYVVPINAVSEYPLYVSYAIDKNGVILYNADSVYKLSAIKDKETTSIQKNALIQGGVNAEIVGKIITIDKMKYIKKPNNVIVIGDGQDFTEIQDALDVVADTEENPYTFLIMPRSQPYGRFSMLRKLDGTYPWTDAKTRYISLIGLDKAHCIIESDTGEYTEPAAEILTNGIIKDLTFVTTKLNPWETPSKPGYAVHIDARTLDDAGYNMIFEDCEFASDVAPAVGVGLHPNCDLTFRRCNFISTSTEDYQPTESYKNLSGYGCFFAHSSQLADAKNQCLTLVDCVGTCKEGNKSLRVNHAGNYSQETAEFTLTLIRNVFWNEKQGSPSYVIDSDLTMNPINYGNNN